MDLIFQDKLNFRQNDKKIKQKVANQNILLVTKALLGNKCESVTSQSNSQKTKSISGSSTARSNAKQGRLLLRDYLYLTNKNSERLQGQKSTGDKKQLRKLKYRLDEQQIINLMQDEIEKELSEVIERLQRMKENFKSRSLKNQDKENNQNISMAYSVKNIIKDKFKKGIEEINMMFFEEEQRKHQLLNPISDNVEMIRSANLLTVDGKLKNMKTRQPKISLQINPNLHQKENNSIPINRSRFMPDFV